MLPRFYASITLIQFSSVKGEKKARLLSAGKSVQRHVSYRLILRKTNYGRFAYGSFRLRSVRLRLESIRLRLICQFAYVLKHVLQQLIHLLYVRSRSDPSRSIQFLERDS